MSQILEQTLRDIEARKTGCYEKRTRHKDDAGHPLFINRLIKEDSPYLLQHAHNPVDWFGWEEEAFSKAIEEDKPVFLSIGYSTCHWCHVMESESFDNVEIARQLNQSFVCIKLDREQFPDIDEYYMTGVQIISGQGGWPMSNFLLPDGRPFYAATYFPPAQFAALLNKISQVWREQREELEQSAQRTAQGIQQVLQGRREIRDIELGRLRSAADRLLQREDTEHGGLAGAPKFPQEPLLFYVLDGAYRDRDQRKIQFLDRALTSMAEGGIYDQVAGGFHRYSTDSRWLVPHFEKMLYNQSQLSLLYLRAWNLTGNPFFLRVVRQTLDYVLREMQLPEGGFYSATDADSEDQEGLFFVWKLSELREILDPDELDLAIKLFAPSEEGNFEGANILSLHQSLASFDHGAATPEFEVRLDRLLEKLLLIRQRRIAPLRDDKLIVGWSAAMANSLAWAGWELREPRYLDAAKRAVDLIWKHNYRAGESLLRIYLNGEVSIPAQLEDYANLCEVMLTFYDITGSLEYLEKANGLMRDLLNSFWNKESGGFYLGPERSGGPGLTRSSSAADGATLSAYGVALQCLVALHERRYPLVELTQDETIDYEDYLQQAIKAASAELDEFPPSHVTLLRAIAHHAQGSISAIRYGSEGRLKLVMRRLEKDADQDSVIRSVLQIQLSTLPGFHVTTETGNDPQLSQLTVSVAAGEKHWAIEKVEVASAMEPSTIGEDTLFIEPLNLTVTLITTEESADLLAGCCGVELQAQVCSDKLCFQPERFRLRL